MAYINSFVVVLCYLATFSGWTEAQTFDTTVSFNGAIEEREGTFEYCVELSSGIITDPVTITLTSVEYPDSATAPDDFNAVNESLEFTQTSDTRQCINVIIHEDTIIEMVDFFEIVATSLNTNVTIMPASHFVSIQDTSTITAGFVPSNISLNEASGESSICTEILVGSVEKSVEIVLSFSDGTASSTTDYTAVSSTGRFNANRNTVCKFATILDDDFIEEDEFFTVSVSGTSSIEVNAAGTLQVIIADNDGATLSIDTTAVAIMEGDTDKVIPLCITLDDIMGGLERPINVTAATMGSTAGDGDFESVSTTLTFPFTSSVTDTMCIEVTVIGDEVYESDETFSVLFSTVNPNDVISGPTMITITIQNDDPIICEDLPPPINGNVTFTSTTVGSTANYTCLPNFDLVPPIDPGFDIELFTRTCENDGKWSEEAPTCKGIVITSSNTPRTVGIAVGVIVGVAVAVIIIVIIIACLVVRRQHHYNKYVLPYKDHVRPYSVYANEEQRQSTHDDITRWEAENPPEYGLVAQVIGEEPQREPAGAEGPGSLEYETEAQVQPEEGEQIPSEDRREFAKVDLDQLEESTSGSGDGRELAMMEFGDESVQEDSIAFQEL